MVIFCATSHCGPKRFPWNPAETTGLSGDGGTRALLRVERNACAAQGDPA